MTPLRALCLSLSVLVLGGCGVQLAGREDFYSAYNKPGVSASTRQADIRACAYHNQATAGGGRVGRSSAMAGLKTEDCLERKGYRRG